MNGPILMEEFLSQIIAFLPQLGLGIGVFLLTLALSSWIGSLVAKQLSRREVDDELIILLRMLSKWSVRILGFMIALEMLMPGRFGSLIAGLGIAGFTIGFALQDVAKNFIAGILLLLQQPFNIGDSIEVGGYTGKVLDISLRTTEIRTSDGRHVIIPNGDVFVSPIVNFSKGTSRRLEISVGVAYDADLDQVARVAIEALNKIPGLQDDPAVSVMFQSFGDSAIEFTAYCWIDTTQVGLGDAKDAGVKALKVAFERDGIDIPYPTQKVISAA